MSAARPSLALVVPAHVGGPVLDACLEAVAALNPAPDELVLAVDGRDAAADPAVQAAAVRARATVVVVPARSGPAAARNAGAAATSSDVVFFVDSDVLVQRDAVARVLAGLSDDVDALFGSYDDQPGDPGFTSQYKNLVHHLVHQRAKREGATFWGACGAVRRGVFAQAGGFDERYRRPCIEDIDLGYRLRALGARVVVDPDLQVTHLKRWSVRGLLRTDLLDRAVPWSLLILRSRVVVDDLGTERRARLQLALTAAAVAAVLLMPVVLPAGLLAVALLATVVALDTPVLAPLARLRSPLFALRSIPWRLAHQLVCLGGLAIAVVRVWPERFGRRQPPVARLRPPADLKAGTSRATTARRGA